MNLKLRALDADAAATHLELVQRALEESAATYLADAEEELSPGVAGRLVGSVGKRDEALVLVAEAGEEPRPMALCLTAPLDDPLIDAPTACIVALWVDPRLRHRGVARAMVQEARRTLAERGVVRIAARTGHTDDALISMGERWGFVRAWEFLVHE